MAKLTLTDITSGYALTTTVNANNDLIEAAIENQLSRDGTSPNTMGANLDMNSNRVVNVSDATNNQDAVTLAQLTAATVVASSTSAALVSVADAGGLFTGTTAEAVLAEIGGEVDALYTTSNGEGASLVGIEDAAGNFTATDVEAALAEIISDLASTSNGLGASTVGVEDSAGDYTGTDVEAVLAEIGTSIGTLETDTYATQIKYKAADESINTSTTLQDDNHITSFTIAQDGVYIVEGYFDYTQNVGDIKLNLVYTAAPAKRSYSVFAVDETGLSDEDTDNGGNDLIITGITDGDDAAITLNGHITGNGSGSSTMKLQWAQNTSDANNTTLRQGSWIRLTRIA